MGFGIRYTSRFTWFILDKKMKHKWLIIKCGISGYETYLRGSGTPNSSKPLSLNLQESHLPQEKISP